MRRMFHPHPSGSFVVAVIALFLALGGTTVAAVVINGASIKNGTITGNKLKNGTLTGTQIKQNSLTGAQIKAASLTGTQIKTDALTGTQINESSLSQVPSAKDADTVGGRAPGSFEPASQWALIAGDAGGANILAQSGGLSVTRFAAGLYLVGSNGSVVSKPLSATFNGFGGFISVAPCGGSANNPGGVNCPIFNNNDHVIVRTLSTAAVLADSTFYVSIGA